MSPESDGAQLTFIGNATTLLRVGAFTVLTDPNFLHAGQRAYLGYGLWSKRRTDPALEIADLPPLDAVVLSHLHGDHWDRVAQRGLPKTLPIVSTPQATRKLRRRGFRAAEGMRTWDSVDWTRDRQRLRVTSVPAVHGPRGVHRLMPATMGSIIDLEEDGQQRLRLYVTGDTLFRPGLAEIGERYPDIDAMLIHLGGTKVAGVLLTMDGRHGARLTEVIRPARTLPIHYDDYTVFRSPLSDFERELADHATKLTSWKRGDTLTVEYRDQHRDRAGSPGTPVPGDGASSWSQPDPAARSAPD
jgi:L-ascorbate metabolism protein UlaG (beta-lactamase superfamily)